MRNDDNDKIRLERVMSLLKFEIRIAQLSQLDIFNYSSF